MSPNSSILALLSFFFSTLSFAGVPQAASLVQLGGQVDSSGSPGCIIPSSATPIFIVSAAAVPVAGNRLGFYNQGVQYQVPSGHSLILCGFYINSNDASVISLGTGYNTGTFSNNSATGAGDTYYGASSTLGDSIGEYAHTQNVSKWTPYVITYPANSYPFFRTSSTAQLAILGVGYVL